MRAQSPATFLTYRTEATGETQNIKPHLSHRINLEEVAACSCKCGQLIEMLQEKPVCLLTDTKDHGWSWSGQIKSIPKKAKWLQQRKLDSCEQISCLEKNDSCVPGCEQSIHIPIRQ